MKTGWMKDIVVLPCDPLLPTQLPFIEGTVFAASLAAVTFSGIIKALFCPKETNRRIYFF